MNLLDLFEVFKEIIENFGYFGIFIGTLLESIFPPIPSEVILGFSGFLISEGRFNPILVFLAAIAGNIISISFIWWLGRTKGREFLIKRGKYFGFKEENLEKAENIFKKYGYPSLIICQFIPLVRSWISFPAGSLKTDYKKFIFYNTFGASIWFIIILSISYNLGENWTDISKIIEPVESVLLVLAVFIPVVYIILKLKHRIAKQKKIN